MTIQLTRRFFALTALSLAVLAVVAVAAYATGQASRKSASQVAAQVRTAVEVRGEQAETDLTAAVADARRTQRAASDRAWKRRMQREVKKAKAASYDKGYTSGNSVGYSAGNSAGYSAGAVDGREEGIEIASDELTCSDDSDVALPACWDY